MCLFSGTSLGIRQYANFQESRIQYDNSSKTMIQHDKDTRIN